MNHDKILATYQKYWWNGIITKEEFLNALEFYESKDGIAKIKGLS